MAVLDVFALRSDAPLTAGEAAALTALLPPARRLRLSKAQKRGGEDALRAYGLLALALRERCGLKALPLMAFAPSGKPYFPDYPGIFFNLSHTRGASLAALSKTPVGVDIDRFRPVSRRMLARFSAGNGEDFFRAWTALEAAAKYTGDGVSAILRQSPESLAAQGVQPLDIFPDCASAVCGDDGDRVETLRVAAVEELFSL